MSFAAPTALFWLALTVPIIGLYILKVRLRRVPVSTNLFWKQIYEEKPPRSIWQYLRHLLSLLLQLLMLGLLAFAVADPYLPWQITQARRMVLVIDRSASMQSTDVTPTRFYAAMEAARSAVEGLRSRDEMAIVLAGPQPEVAIGMTSHIPTLKRTLDTLQPSDGPTDLQPAIDLSHKLIGEHPKGQVIVLTDGCEKTVESPKPDLGNESSAAEEAGKEQETLVLRQVFATDAANIGITQFQVRRSLIDRLGYQILVEAKNAGAAAVSCRIEIELDGLPVDILPLKLEPEEVWNRALEKTSLEGGRLTARITEISVTDPEQVPGPADSAQNVNSLSADDIAFAVLPPREIQQVLIITPGNLFLQKVFEANPLVAVEVLHALPSSWPAGTLIVLHQLIPETLPPGNVLVVDPAESTDLWTIGESLADPIVTDQDVESPLMTHVRLDNVLMPQARKLEPAGPAHVLAGSVSGDPIYAELLRDNGKCLVLTVNLEESDLAFRTTFPIMASNALGWFAGTSGELNRALSTGDVTTITVKVPSSQSAIRPQLVGPDGHSEELTIPEQPPSPAASTGTRSPAEQTAEIAIGPLYQTGVYEIVAGEPEAESAVNELGQQVLSEVAVNLANQYETDLRPPQAALVANAQQPAVAGWISRPVWFYLTVLACVLTVTEWFLYQRRMID